MRRRASGAVAPTGPSAGAALALGAAALLLGAASCSKGPRRIELRSSAVASEAERVSRLCALVRCPTRPEDAAYELSYEDPTRDLSLGPQRLSLVAVLRVPAAEQPRWTRDCRVARLEPRPAWIAPLLKERGWRTNEAPQMLRCDGEERHVHVRDGLVLRRIVPPEH